MTKELIVMTKELINSLMWKAGARFEMMNWVHYDDFDYEKFAELIVEECNKESALQIEKLLSNAKQDVNMLKAYHKWCEMNGCAPSSSDLIAASNELEK